jgi:GDSL-like lipase/acylhydrolase family protein
MSISLKSGAMVGLLLGLAACGSAGIDPGEDSFSESEEEFGARRIKYLALGDSIAFGFNPLVAAPQNPRAYRGYPEVIGTILPNSVTNAGCPGETSGSLLSDTAADNGCRNWKLAYSLHADYETTQIAFARDFIVKNPDTKFVSLNIGANDLLLLQKKCVGDLVCIKTNLPAALAAYGQNLGATYATLRAAGFTGKFVGLTTYAINYNDPLSVGALTALNQVMAQVTTAFGGVVADGFGTFKFFADKAGGDSCAAGLLIKLPDQTCDIHPSQKGRDILAVSVVAAAVR